MKMQFRFFLMALIGLFMVSCAQKSDSERRAEIMERLEAGEIPADVEIFAINTLDSEVLWEGKKITGSGHNGSISISQGEFYVYEGVLLAGNVIIDMQSIVVLDIEDQGSNARLKGHLESDDFFSVASFPTAEMEIISFEPIADAAPGQPNYRVSGNLTIKGITHGIAFGAFVEMDDSAITAFAEFSFDRALYDVRFGSGSFFDNLGDNLINDEIELKIDLVAVK